MQLDGTTVLITGGNKGLGQAIVKRLLPTCKKIIIVDRSEQIVKDEKIEYIKIDLLKDKPEPREVDLFISNLGMSVGAKKFTDMSDEEVENMIKINLQVPLWMYKNFKFKKFVFIGSVLSYRGIENYSMYCASKAFLRIFNQSLQREGEDTMIANLYKLNTDMFAEIKDFRTLDVHDVAKRIVTGVEKDEKEINLPAYWGYSEAVFGLTPRFMTNWAMDKILQYFMPSTCNKKKTD